MNTSNIQQNYKATAHVDPSVYAAQPAESESRIDKAYVISLRGILKFGCLLFSFVAFICLISAPKCYTNHIFLATVTWLVIIAQFIIVILSVFRLQTKFSGIDFDLLDFVVTSHDAFYLLIASSITIHYCHIPGQVAAGAIALVACALLVGDLIAIFIARREQTATNSNGTR